MANRMSDQSGGASPGFADSSPAHSESPIFVTGFARSGTTWLNQLMRDYFDAGFVNEGQFIIAFGRRLGRYGDLRLAVNHERLIEALSKDGFFSTLRKNYSVEMDWCRVADAGASFSAIVKDVLQQIAEQMGKRRIGSKYPVFGRHLDLLNNLFPDGRVIHVVRDGRDCALSHKQMTWGHQNTYSAAIHWRAYIQAARRGSEAMRGRYLEIRYEDLLLEPEATMHTLEHFITDSRTFPITKRFVEEKAVQKTERASRWRTDMPASAQAIFESVAGDALESCGYPLAGLTRKPSLISRAGYVVHDRATREGWNVLRKLFKGIPERK